MRSVGSIMLLQSPGTQAEKAEQLGVAQATISRWQSGASCPLSFVHRDACRRIFGIPLDARAEVCRGLTRVNADRGIGVSAADRIDAGDRMARDRKEAAQGRGS